MADTRRSKAALAALLADNTTGAISPQDIRDFLESAAPPFGSMYISTAADTSISQTSTYTKVAGTTTLTNADGFDMPANNRLRYTGAPDVHVHVAVTISMTTTGSNQVIFFRVGKNGSAVITDAVASTVARKVGTGADIGSTALHFDTMMSNGDYIELFVANDTSATNAQVDYMYFFALGMLV
jgi:hypothetical protein